MLLLVAMAPAYGQNLWTHPDLTLVDPGPEDAAVQAVGLDCRFGQVYHGRCQVRTERISTGSARLGITFDTGEPGGQASEVLGRGVAPGPGQRDRSTGPDWVDLEVLGAVPEGATRALLHIIVDGNPSAAGACAHFRGVEFRRLPPAVLPNLWPYGSSTTLADPGNGGIAIKAKAFEDVQAGELFTGECLVRTSGFNTGQAELGIAFDRGERSDAVGLGQAMGPDQPDRTSVDGPVRLRVRGQVPVGATRALVCVIVRGNNAAGAQARFEHVTFHRLPAERLLPPDIWPHGPDATLIDGGPGRQGILAKAIDCKAGEVYLGECTVEADPAGFGMAELGISFDTGEGPNGEPTPVLGRGVGLGPGASHSTRNSGRTRLFVQGTAPAGATRALLFIRTAHGGGAQARFQGVAFRAYTPAEAPPAATFRLREFIRAADGKAAYANLLEQYYRNRPYRSENARLLLRKHIQLAVAHYDTHIAGSSVRFVDARPLPSQELLGLTLRHVDAAPAAGGPRPDAFVPGPITCHLEAGPYVYRDGEAYVVFANRTLGGGILHAEFAQEELAVLPSTLLPWIAPVRGGWSRELPLLRDLGLDSGLEHRPAVIKVRRFLDLLHGEEIYLGNRERVAGLDPDRYLRPADRPMDVFLTALAAVDFNEREPGTGYAERDIEAMALLAVRGFYQTLMAQYVDNRPLVIHTGNWGTGVFRNSHHTIWSIQRAAVEAAYAAFSGTAGWTPPLDYYFHGYDDKGVMAAHEAYNVFSGTFPKHQTLGNYIKLIHAKSQADPKWQPRW
jgi:hypothetical protein